MLFEGLEVVGFPFQIELDICRGLAPLLWSLLANDANLAYDLYCLWAFSLISSA